MSYVKVSEMLKYEVTMYWDMFTVMYGCIERIMVHECHCTRYIYCMRLKRKVIGSLPEYPLHVYKYGTWPTYGMQARPVGVTSGIHAPTRTIYRTWPTCGMQDRPV